MPERWLTIAEAAMIENVHPRTIERRVKAGKIQTRRADDGQVQVLIEAPDAAAPTSEVINAVADQADKQVQLALVAGQALVKSAQEDARLARQDVARAWDEAYRARAGTRRAWAAVAVMAMGVCAAVGWVSHRVTGADATVQNLASELQMTQTASGEHAQEAEGLRVQLMASHERAARAEGELAAVTTAARTMPAPGAPQASVVSLRESPKPTTRPTLLEHIAGLFN